jgi:hypothetical protein
MSSAADPGTSGGRNRTETGGGHGRDGTSETGPGSGPDGGTGDDGDVARGLWASLGRVGAVLRLTGVALALAAVTVAVLLLAAGGLSRVAPGLGGLVLVVGLVGASHLLFGSWDWSAGGETRQHATFLALFVGLQAGGHATLRSLGGAVPANGAPFLVLGVVGLALAGWLAYLGGLGRLTSLAP